MRPILLFLFIALLALVVLQNLSPVVALTFLGMQTVALPLAVWLVGAVLAGAVTTVLVAALIRFLAKGRLPRRSARRPSRRPSGTRGGGQGEPWTPPPWTGGWTKPLDPEPVDRAGGASRPSASAWAAAEDDWENPQPANEWDDWEDAPPRASAVGSRTVIQDVPYREISPPIEPEPVYPERPYEAAEAAYQYRPYDAEKAPPDYSYRPYEAVEEPSDSAYRYRPYLDEEPEEEREIWDDWEEEPPAKPAAPSRPEEPPAEPRRPIVEINREPETGYRAGTVYSYSYRRAEPNTPTDNIKAPPDESPKGSSDASASDAGSAVADATTTGATSSASASSADGVTDLSADAPADPSRVDPDQARSIYEADFRVIMPPSYPDAEPIAPDEADGEEDWEAEDEDEAERDRPPAASDGEIWDDESWGDDADPPAPAKRGSLNREIWDDWDDDDDNRDRPDAGAGGSGRSPEGNPPLRLG